MSRFLSHAPYVCAHDHIRYIRGLDDVRSWLSQNGVGSVETSGAAWWRLARAYRPDLRMAVVRRDRREVVDSLMRFGLFDRAKLAAAMARSDRALDSAARAPGCIEVGYHELDHGGAARLFEHCIGEPVAASWMAQHQANVQSDLRATYAYMVAHQAQMARTAKVCATAVRRITLRPARPQPDANGVVVQEEPWADFWRDGQPIMSEHAVAVGHAGDHVLGMNYPAFEALDAAGMGLTVTARINGRIVGYITGCITPTLEKLNELSLVQMSVFASRDVAGLNVRRRLQSVALTRARSRGAVKAYFRSGIVGDGPRLGAVWKRMGAVEYGQLYELDMAEWN